MSKEHYDELLRTNKMRATGETTTSPNMAFSEGYEGILVQFKVKRGTIEKLETINRYIIYAKNTTLFYRNVFIFRELWSIY